MGRPRLPRQGLADLNPKLKDTQFADYHGHGWNFRAVFKRDRKGDLLDAGGNVVPDDDPQKFKKAVHLSSIHVDMGMQCVDCHFAQDNHGNGHIYGEVGARGRDRLQGLPRHRRRGTRRCAPAAPPHRRAAPTSALLRNPDGRNRFEWRGRQAIQRSMLDPKLEWEVSW